MRDLCRLVTHQADLNTAGVELPAGRLEARRRVRPGAARRVFAIALTSLFPLLLQWFVGGAGPTVKTVPFYRLVMNLTEFHAYTTNAIERDTLCHVGFKDEGIAGYVLPIDTPITAKKRDVIKPFVRLYDCSINYKNYLYTADLNERNKAVASGQWKVFGEDCLIAVRKLPGTVPLYRFSKPFSKTHYYYYTADEQGYFNLRHGSSWSYDGIAGYIWPKEVELTGIATYFKVTRKHTSKTP